VTAGFFCQLEVGSTLAKVQNKKGRPCGRPWLNRKNLLLRLGGLLRSHDGLFAFDVSLAAFFMFSFVQLFAHKCLYFVRVLRFCGCTMKVYTQRFNIFFALGMAATLVCGCQTDKTKGQISVLRVHLQANQNTVGATVPVTLLRSNPVSVTIAQDPILSEANVIAARTIETPGGFAVEVQFDESSSLMLEQYSSANPGLHFVIFGQWGEKIADGRWLAAPLITHRIPNGQLAFTPDITRAQADRLVLGLNNVAKQLKKGVSK
jgi:hypothetical protein